LWYLLAPSLTSSAVKAPENVKEEPDDPEQTDEGGIQLKRSSD
jgi:hypothetical protein